MPIFGGKQIAELQQKLAIVEQQYNDAQRTIAELSSLIERAGGGEITRMRAVVEQTRQEQEAAIASLRQQHEQRAAQLAQEQETAIASLSQEHAQYATQLAQEQAAAEKRLRDINKEVKRSQAQLAQEQAAAEKRLRDINKEVKRSEAAAEKRLRDINKEVDKSEATLAGVKEKTVQQKEELRALGIRYDEGIKMLDAGWTDYDSPAASSVALKEQLDEVRAKIKEMIRTGAAVDASKNFVFNNSETKGRKFVRDMAKMMLRAYNAEAENCVLTVKAGNGNVARNRLERARDQIVKLGALINLQINFHYHRLRIKELELTLQYQNAKKAEKEAEREERARLREQARAEKELRAERERLEKERQHYLNVLKAVEEAGNSTEAEKLRQQLAEIEEGINDVEKREANSRAGYVYVISNIGSFGERMVKIGMTRRLDPMDRVRELGDASVPFNFDVHALFFSDDAVSVETELHHRFAAKRVNRINARREFFYATPAEVREALKDIAGNLLEFTEEPEAEQYRLSLEEARASARR